MAFKWAIPQKKEISPYETNKTVLYQVYLYLIYQNYHLLVNEKIEIIPIFEKFFMSPQRIYLSFVN
jgi:hypothetical protein